MRSHAARVRRLALGGALVLVCAVRPAFGIPGVPAGDQAGTAALQSAGLTALRVGAISIQIGDVFDIATGGAWAPLTQAANLLHPRTRPSVVRRELLFRTGDRFDAEALRQTERNLRALGLFRRVEVLTLPPQDGEVGIVVRVFDAWSLTTGTSFRHEGGFSSYDVRSGRATWPALAWACRGGRRLDSSAARPSGPFPTRGCSVRANGSASRMRAAATGT